MVHVAALDTDETGGAFALGGVEVALVVDLGHAGFEGVWRRLLTLPGFSGLAASTTSHSVIKVSPLAWP